MIKAKLRFIIISGSILATSLLTYCSTTTHLKRQIRFSVMADSKKEVAKAIIWGCGERGWICQENDGSIIGTLDIRKHHLKIKINYNTKSVTYIYQDSKNLHYDGTVIHKRYHIWIDNLHSSVIKGLR